MIARLSPSHRFARLGMLAMLAGISAASAQVQKTARPVAEPSSRDFATPLSVSLTTPTSGSAIFYTLDGSIPDTVAGGATRMNTAPIAITMTTQIKAIAFKAGAGWYASDVATLIYTFMPQSAPDHGWYLDSDGDGRVFPMYDSVPPVLISAAATDASPSEPYPAIQVLVSEPLRTADFWQAFRYLAPGRGNDSLLPLLSHPQAGPDAREFTLRLDPDALYVPGAGDSIGLVADGGTTDLYGNAPKRVNYIELSGTQVNVLPGRPDGPGRRESSPDAARSIPCYSVKGAWLGMAGPSEVTESWKLPGGKQAVIVGPGPERR